MSNCKSMLPISQAVQPLATFAAGESAIISGFLGGCKLQGRLIALGLFPGQRLVICQNNGSSLVIKINGNSLALGRGVSQKILATPTNSPCCRHDCHCPIKDKKNQS